MAYHQVQREDIEALRFLQPKNARLVKPKRGLRGAHILVDYRKPDSKATVEVTPKMVKWFTTGGLVTPHKRETVDNPDMEVYALTSRGKDFAERDLRAVGQRAEAENGTVKEIILKAVQEAGKTGIAAETIKTMLLDKHGIRTHYKTVGMTLYRFSTEGLVRRKGWTWFAKPQKKTRTVTPAEVVDSGTTLH